VIKRTRRRRLRALPINSLIPNILTVLALCAGMSAIRFALQDNWQAAVAAVAIAGVFDGLDGRMARLLKGATKFGAELDSLSDFIAFGVAPAFVVFLWSTHDIKGIGWIAALAFSTCCALRLARFNTATEEPDRPVWTGYYFTGLAAPAGAGIALLPVMGSFLFGDNFLRQPLLVSAWMLFVGLLMISRVPTYSLKRIRVRREHVLPTLVVVGLLAAVMVSFPWVVLTAVGCIYLLSVPFSFRSQRQFAAGRREIKASRQADTSDRAETPDQADTADQREPE